jgi:uncharacterized membrane protein
VSDAELTHYLGPIDLPADRVQHPWVTREDADGDTSIVLSTIYVPRYFRVQVASGEWLDVTFARLPARDLTTSIAWALYALILLGLGVGRRSLALRWASLGLLLVTIAKVFLHDLGELRDLYRVASLLGLAVSLILVSRAYQRFVFRDSAAES